MAAWLLDGQILCDLCDRKQPMLLHCCPQSESAACKISVQKCLAGRIKVVTAHPWITVSEWTNC